MTFPTKKVAQPVFCLWNSRPMKVLNNTKLILNDQSGRELGFKAQYS